MSKLIATVWEYILEVWHLHCDAVHGKEFQSTDKQATLARKVEAVFDLEPWVNHTHKKLFSTPIDDLRQRSVRYLTIWLAVAAPIAKQARDNQTRTSSNQLENYFHIQNT